MKYQLFISSTSYSLVLMYKYKTDRFDISRKQQIAKSVKQQQVIEHPFKQNKDLVRQSDTFVNLHYDSDDDIQDELNEMVKRADDELNIDYSDDEDYEKVTYVQELTKDDCKYCGMKNSIQTIVSEGIRVCTNPDCKTINTQILDETAEWRHYNDDSSDGMVRCRIQQPVSYTPGTYNKLKILQNWLSITPKERTHNKLLSNMVEQCTIAGIKKCAIDDIKCIYNECTHGTVEEGSLTVRGLNKSELLAAITMYACKKRKIPRLPEEIADIYKLNVSDLSNGWRTFTELMRLKGKHYDMINSEPEEYLVRLAPKLNVGKEFINLAVYITQNIKLIGIASEHTPPSIAAASILLTAQIKEIGISVTEVSEIFYISSTTSDKIMNKIEEFKKVIIDRNKSLEIAKLIHERRKLLAPLM